MILAGEWTNHVKPYRNNTRLSLDDSVRLPADSINATFRAFLFLKTYQDIAKAALYMLSCSKFSNISKSSL